MTLSVEIPAEPPDRAVVLDRDAVAWQSRNGRWVAVRTVLFAFDAMSRSWAHLVVDHGPLTALVTEGEDESVDEDEFTEPPGLDGPARAVIRAGARTGYGGAR